jgi:hypothetical protein
LERLEQVAPVTANVDNRFTLMGRMSRYQLGYMPMSFQFTIGRLAVVGKVSSVLVVIPGKVFFVRGGVIENETAMLAINNL